MTYRGQIIQEFKVNRDGDFFTNQAEQIIALSRFLMVFLIAGAIIALFSQLGSVESIDILIFIGFVIFILFLYRALLNRVTLLRDPDLLEMDEQLIIYEYGIEFPPITNTSIGPTDTEYTNAGHQYVTYNDINSIQLGEDNINVITAENQFSIDLIYFPFYSTENDNYEGQISLFHELFEKISQNLAKIENRDHPTIIPKAYFRDVLDKYSS